MRILFPRLHSQMRPRSFVFRPRPLAQGFLDCSQFIVRWHIDEFHDHAALIVDSEGQEVTGVDVSRLTDSPRNRGLALARYPRRFHGLPFHDPQTKVNVPYFLSVATSRKRSASVLCEDTIAATALSDRGWYLRTAKAMVWTVYQLSTARNALDGYP